MTDVKRLMEEYEAAEAKANTLDDLWGENPEDEELEAAWMEAYKEEHRTFKALTDWICKNTNWKVDEHAARAIIHGKRDEFKQLIGFNKEATK